MGIDDSNSPSVRQQLILASALLHTSPPGDQVRANCSRVLRHAMIAAGVWDDHYERGQSAAFHGEYNEYPLVKLWYESLISLTRREPAERLLEGAGNLEVPAGARFTACWLTPLGKEIAEHFLAKVPNVRHQLLKDHRTH